LRINRGRVDRGAFPPHEVAQVTAIACALPRTHGLPLSRFGRSELHRFVVEQAVSAASASTIGRWSAEDAIKPWQQRSWIFPRDPRFVEKAGPILDLYQGRWEGRLLEPGDCVISADATPSIQARKRIHPGAPPAPGRGQRVEREYQRCGAVCYPDAWDVRRGRVMGRTEPRGGIAAFDRLVWQVMTKEPTDQRRACSGSSTTAPITAPRRASTASRAAGRTRSSCIPRSTEAGSTRSRSTTRSSSASSWIPTTSTTPRSVARALNDFEHRYNEIAKPFDWNFTRADLAALMDRLDDRDETSPIRLAA
jgi:hypothetical protein